MLKCKNCESKKNSIRKEYKGNMEGYCSLECYNRYINSTRCAPGREFDQDSIAEQAKKCIILGKVYKFDIEEQFEKAKTRLDQMLMMETHIWNETSVAESENMSKNNVPRMKIVEREFVGHISMIALFYKHIAYSEINRPTSFKLTMKYISCRVLEKMIVDGAIHESFVGPYLKDHPDIIDFSKYTCSLCNDVMTSSSCDCR